jgi:hypothetical protein
MVFFSPSTMPKVKLASSASLDGVRCNNLILLVVFMA